jgi:predicted GNAT family N-acyltransferase
MIVEYRVVSDMESLMKAFAVRAIVFVEEQGVAFVEEMDGRDFSAVHFLATLSGEPVAAARLRVCRDYIKIERLAVRKQYRGKGIGKEMFAFVLKHIAETGYGKKLVLHAQAYLTRFYEEFGFEKKGEAFTEAGIEHYYMEQVPA